MTLMKKVLSKTFHSGKKVKLYNLKYNILSPIERNLKKIREKKKQISQKYYKMEINTIRIKLMNKSNSICHQQSQHLWSTPSLQNHKKMISNPAKGSKAKFPDLIDVNRIFLCPKTKLKKTSWTSMAPVQVKRNRSENEVLCLLTPQNKVTMSTTTPKIKIL